MSVQNVGQGLCPWTPLEAGPPDLHLYDNLANACGARALAYFERPYNYALKLSINRSSPRRNPTSAETPSMAFARAGLPTLRRISPARSGP